MTFLFSVFRNEMHSWFNYRVKCFLNYIWIFLAKRITAKLAKKAFFLGIIFWASEHITKSPRSLGTPIHKTLFLDDPFSPVFAEPIINFGVGFVYVCVSVYFRRCSSLWHGHLMICVQVWLCNVSLKKKFRKSEEKMKMSKQKDKNLVNVHYQFSVLFSKKLFSYFDFFGWYGLLKKFFMILIVIRYLENLLRNSIFAFIATNS